MVADAFHFLGYVAEAALGPSTCCRLFPLGLRLKTPLSRCLMSYVLFLDHVSLEAALRLEQPGCKVLGKIGCNELFEAVSVMAGDIQRVSV